MADHDHLETFATSQAGALAKAVLEEFKGCCRGGDVAQAEYAQRLRQVLEARFADELRDA